MLHETVSSQPGRDTTRSVRKLRGGSALELRQRGHARVEDRIREAKNTGLRNLPCKDFTANNAWLQVALTAIDLIAWTQLLAFADVADLAKCEINTFRYRVLHVAARL